ncbi:hypothetical protein [Altererythrobacter sp. MF3-039]|uniref:hypothetical protein n=1 Tax=Altererythrobacter sp. MF3-039 TaxID=3252901 RepID=UPI00390CA973
MDAIVDLVVSREAPFHWCLEVTSEGGLVAEFPDEYNAPNNGGWDVNQFEDPQVVDAARRIAVSLDEAVKMERETKVLHLIGMRDPNSDGCVMSLSHPTFSGDYAFLSFMNPGGEFGHYALERNDSGWRVKERVFTGWW